MHIHLIKYLTRHKPRLL